MEESNVAHPGIYVREHVVPEGMSVTKAAETMGIGRPALSNFLNGNAALSPEMAARLKKAFGADADDLMRRQAEYDAQRRRSDRVVSATARRFVPPFLMAKANDIQNWADTHRSRDQLAVFLRMLINSTCDGLEFIDFPGNDDAQRPGWDGMAKTAAGNPWVPQGESCWEFGTDAGVASKANKDHAKRTAVTDEAERRRTAFVFVTPRRWPGKETWVRDRQAEGQWRDVLAWDASDLEQWLEQSIPAQAWFAARRGRTFRGVKSLERCWVEWCADCEPGFTGDVFKERISAFGDKVVNHLRSETQDVLRIVADSRQEALAFVAAVLCRSDELIALKDRLVVFTERGALSNLAAGSGGFIPVIAQPDVEVELAESGSPLKALVVDHRTAVQLDSDISLEPLSQQGFQEALGSMGLGRDEINRFDRESGRSLTVLRRRLALSEAIRAPSWCADPKLAVALAPMAFAGAWVASNEADRYLIGELAGRDYEQLEDDFTQLRNLEDSPVWSVGDYGGVVSKVDALYGLARWISANMIDRFLLVAGIVLSERDPALDLPEDRQWEAPLHNKVREISSPLRKGIGESLVLLAIHGSRLFGNHNYPEPERKVANLIRELLEQISADELVSQSSNLPLYAEAAPEVFLDVFERDVIRPEPVVDNLMQPAENIMFGRSDRVHLLWALELLAWQPRWLNRVVDLLASLAEREPDDNLANKASESLQAIFRSWMPQTGATLEDRVAALDRLAGSHSGIAWDIASAQFDRGRTIGSYAHKPIWRDYAIGFGETVTGSEWREFVRHCIDTCIDWPSHTRDTLADLMERTESLDSNHLARLGDAVTGWAQCASDQDRAWLRERIRISSRRTIRRKAKDQSLEGADQAVLVARKAFQILEPQDRVWKHAWLFDKPWVPESWDDLEDDIDIHARDERIRIQRRDAAREVLSDSGMAGILRLAFTGDASHVVGRSIAEVVEEQAEGLSFVRSVLRDNSLLASRPHQLLISGLFTGMDTTRAVSLVETLWPECGHDVGVTLLCLTGFEKPVWNGLAQFCPTVAHEYWARVEPSYGRLDNEEIDYAVAQLVAVGRPLAALDLAHIDWGRVESKHIQAILSDLPGSEEKRHGSARVHAYSIQRAFKVLNQRRALTQTEMAQLEWLYMDLFWLDEEGVPNLEREVEAKPELFWQAVTLVYRGEGLDYDQLPTEDQKSAATRAYRVLHKLARIPGHDDNGDLCADELTDWVRKVQELCESNGRRCMGDQHIGQLLSKAPTGKDGAWPCEPVREALEAVLNEDIETGFQIGRQNSRGAQIRGDGGAQERALAAQYEGWAKCCEYSYPRVAKALRGLVDTYKSEGQWWDQRAAIQQRLGY